MSDIQCSTCGATIALADAEESVVSAAVKNHDRFCRAPGWGDAPLRSLPTSSGRGSKMRRDLTELDGDFLAIQLADAWQPYLATYHARNASIGAAIFDADEVEAELRLLLVEAATRFDHLRGSGNFAAWACDRQRTMLLDISRKQMGRRVSDVAIAASRGEVISTDLAIDLRRFYALKHSASLDDPLPSGRLLHDIIPDLSTTTPRGNTMSTPALHAVDDGKRPHPKKLVDHSDKRIAAAAKKVMDAIDRLDQVWAENAAKAELRAERDRLKAQLKKVEAQLRGGATQAPARDWKAIREWAAGSGLDFAATGKVPKAIVDAYDQAHA